MNHYRCNHINAPDNINQWIHEAAFAEQNTLIVTILSVCDKIVVIFIYFFCFLWLWHWPNEQIVVRMFRTPVVNFINVFKYKFFVRTLFWQIFYVHVTRKAYETTFVGKTRAKKVWRNWPLELISATFYEQLLCVQIPKAKKTPMTWLSFYASEIFSSKSCA